MTGTHLHKNHTQILNNPSWQVSWIHGSHYPQVLIEDPDLCSALAMANSSGDEMTDSEFNNFTISKDNLFFFKDKDEDSSTLDLTTHLKWLLKISDPSKYIAYFYDNPDYFMDATNFTDSSNVENSD